jgi:hypothetical protein
VSPATNGWLTPVHSDYYYADAGDGSTGYLAILSVTSDRDISQLDRKIDPALIDDSSSMFFAVSPELFLKNVIQPVIPRFSGAPHPTCSTANRAPTSCKTWIRSTCRM